MCTIRYKYQFSFPYCSNQYSAKYVLDPILTTNRLPNLSQLMFDLSKSCLTKQKLLAYLAKSVEELELSVRSYNCLKNANIQTIAELVQKNDAEMLKTRNFGRKSLNEIKEILEEMGLSLGMKLDDDDLKQINSLRKKKEMESEA